VSRPDEDFSSRAALDRCQGGVSWWSVAMCALWAFLGDRDSDQSIEIRDRVGFEDAPLPCGEMCGQPNLTAQAVRTRVRLGQTTGHVLARRRGAEPYGVIRAVEESTAVAFSSMIGRNRPSATVLWPTVGDARKTARAPLPQLNRRSRAALARNGTFAAETQADGNAQIAAIRGLTVRPVTGHCLSGLSLGSAFLTNCS
jgi:hypothetical protein